MRELIEGPAGEPIENGAPFFFATGGPPTVTAIDDDVYLTVTAAMPGEPGDVRTIDIILSLDHARHVAAELTRAVAQAATNEAYQAATAINPPARGS